MATGCTACCVDEEQGGQRGLLRVAGATWQYVAQDADSFNEFCQYIQCTEHDGRMTVCSPGEQCVFANTESAHGEY